MADGGGEALDLASAMSELYGAPLSEFVATRGALAKRARASGDADVARQIQALRKPTAAAWLVNQVSRQHRDEVAELIDLGRVMREDMGGLDAEGLRELTRQRHRLVSGLVDLARRVGADSGQRVGDDAVRAIQATFEATLSDADSADAVRAGTLAEPLQVSGFGAAFAFAPTQTAPRPDLRAVGSGDAGAPVTDLADRRARKEAEIADAEEGLADAELLSQQATEAHEQAQEHTAELQGVADEASERIDRLQAELDEARADLAERTQAVKAAKQAESDAEKAVRAATRSLASAAERLRRLRR